jgi:hypothetical protein
LNKHNNKFANIITPEHNRDLKVNKELLHITAISARYQHSKFSAEKREDTGKSRHFHQNKKNYRLSATAAILHLEYTHSDGIQDSQYIVDISLRRCHQMAWRTHHRLRPILRTWVQDLGENFGGQILK